MPGQFNLNPSSGSMSPDAYRQLIAQNMTRYGGDRDQAVRSANIAGGFGNSTAQRFMHPSGGPAAATGAGPASTPPPRPAPAAPGLPESGPIPMSREAGSPDLAVSPPHEMWPGATSGAVPQNAVSPGSVPTNPAMSMASILRFLPPELVNNGLPGMPPFKPGLGNLYVPPGELADRDLRGRGRDPRYPIAGTFG